MTTHLETELRKLREELGELRDRFSAMEARLAASDARQTASETRADRQGALLLEIQAEGRRQHRELLDQLRGILELLQPRVTV